MVQYEPYDPNVEASGETIRSMLDGVSDLSSVFEKRMRDTLSENGIEDPQPGEWYSQAAYLESFSEVGDTVGPQTLRNIGKKIPDNAEWPPEIDTVAGGLASIDDAYQMNHRGGEIGEYEFEKTGEGEGRITCRNPYPCEFDKGLAVGVAEKFSSGSALVDIEEVGDTCRASGGDTCVYRVEW